ncbi:MAG: glycosyltransferase family 4 protein, partial [Deltaproteobacteria bacterium]|nr:glycosyltransferase family 4 protein [Deltaproteobacteria bacterium]
MIKSTLGMQHSRGIAFLGNYLPRKCGIATFTYDLAESLAIQLRDEQRVIVAAMNDRPEGYTYPERVKFELRQDYLVDYTRAADFLNFSDIDIVSLQHEYGIFGGDHGSNVLTFLRSLNRPVAVTCHTVLENPMPVEREILREIADHSQKLVVMNQRAFGFLESSYNISRDKIAYIPHGTHYAPFIDPSYYKDKFGVEGRKVLLTFGLLNRTKGIEHMIEALPAIIKKHPRTTYIVLGATHPAVVRMEGEAYRIKLQRRVRELGMEENVIFYPHFVELNELLEYLGASDIFVTPYLNLQQITSGALSYAMGTGKAVVSTPYWHAKELLSDGRGIIVPPGDHKALSREINGLLDDEVKLSAMRKRAYTHCQSTVWSKVAQQYIDLFNEIRQNAPVSVPVSASPRLPISATNLPTLKLDHLLRLTDDTGPSKHAKYSIPDWNAGYSLDDAAATMVASCKFHNTHGGEESIKLAETCIILFQTLISDGDCNGVAERLDYSRKKQGTASEDTIGMAIWALGYMVLRGPSHLVGVASDLFHQILPAGKMVSSRAACYAVLGAANYLKSFVGASAIRRFMQRQADVMSKGSLNWYDSWETADWPLAVQAHFVAG